MRRTGSLSYVSEESQRRRFRPGRNDSQKSARYSHWGPRYCDADCTEVSFAGLWIDLLRFAGLSAAGSPGGFSDEDAGHVDLNNPRAGDDLTGPRKRQALPRCTLA